MTKAIVKNTAGQATLLVFKKRNRTKGMIVANSSTKTKNFKIRQTNIQLLLLLRKKNLHDTLKGTQFFFRLGPTKKERHKRHLLLMLDLFWVLFA